jgi:hypothetical protein
MPTFPKTTTERIAACDSVGLHYWSDSPIAHTVWASGDDRRFHLVRLDRVTRTAHHVCGHGYEKPGMMLTRRCWYGQPIGQWTDVTSVAEIEGSMLGAAAALLGRR